MNKDEIKDYYQQLTLSKWWNESNAKGTAELATGTGKTKIGVLASDKLAKNKNYDYNILILTPTEVLRDNAWIAEFKKWKALKTLTECVNIVCIQTAYKFRDQYYDLVIADEMHNYLSPEFREFWYNNKIDKILGLSAKIPDEYRHILDEIAPVFYSINTTKAKELELISDYCVYNIGIELTEQERKTYDEADQVLKDHPHLITNNYTSMPHFIKNAIDKRKRILYSAFNKLEAIETISQLFIKRDGLIFTKDIDNAERIKDRLKDTALSYHSGQPAKIRKEVMKVFSDKRTKINRLISIKALNEGVNVPSVSLIILASYDSTQKNWIQQAGRGLRLEEDKIAYIFNLYSVNTVEQKWLKNKTQGEQDMKWFKSVNDFINWYNTKRDKE